LTQPYFFFKIKDMCSKNKIFFIISSIVILSIGLSLPAQATTSEYKAQRVAQSHAAIPEVAPGTSFTFWVKFLNTGTRSWSGTGPDRVILRTSSGMKSRFAHPTWFDNNTPNLVNPVLTIFPNEEALFRFSILAPTQDGLWWEEFNLFWGGTPIPGGKIEIPVKVTSTPAPAAEEAEKPPPEPRPTPEPLPEPVPEKELFWQAIPTEINIKEKPGQEPEVRVGLLYIEEDEDKKYLPLKISAPNRASYDIYDKNDFLLIRNTQGELVEIIYDRKIERYFINNEKGFRLMLTDSYLKFRPTKEEASFIFKIVNWQNGPFWDSNEIDNEFQGTLEVRYNPRTQHIWLINQLPMETYLKCLGEAGDSSPTEFLKAQIIAARTYAMFREISPKYTDTPDGNPLFMLMATQADQVYRGYRRALRSPNTTRAVEATRGIIATYENNPILAYYFAQSDGKTRSSYEARMTKKLVAYLVSKNDPPGEGKTLLGHGVGMPQRSAIVAAREGANFSQILKYYYTGIELTKIY